MCREPSSQTKPISDGRWGFQAMWLILTTVRCAATGVRAHTEAPPPSPAKQTRANVIYPVLGSTSSCLSYSVVYTAV